MLCFDFDIRFLSIIVSRWQSIKSAIVWQNSVQLFILFVHMYQREAQASHVTWSPTRVGFEMDECFTDGKITHWNPVVGNWPWNLLWLLLLCTQRESKNNEKRTKHEIIRDRKSYLKAEWNWELRIDRASIVCFIFNSPLMWERNYQSETETSIKIKMLEVKSGIKTVFLILKRSGGQNRNGGYSEGQRLVESTENICIKITECAITQMRDQRMSSYCKKVLDLNDLDVRGNTILCRKKMEINTTKRKSVSFEKWSRSFKLSWWEKWSIQDEDHFHKATVHQ